MSGLIWLIVIFLVCGVIAERVFGDKEDWR